VKPTLSLSGKDIRPNLNILKRRELSPSSSALPLIPSWTKKRKTFKI
jgi:hypothetical protein